MNTVIGVTGKIIPIANGTRIRTEPNTYSTVRSSANAGANVEITEVIEYLTTDPAKPATQKGDKWGKISKINGVPAIEPSYMAIVYHGEQICTPQYVPVVVDPPPAEEVIVYPDFILVGPAGAQRKYVPDGQ